VRRDVNEMTAGLPEPSRHEVVAKSRLLVSDAPTRLRSSGKVRATSPVQPDYPAFLAALKERILHARTSAARAVNRELVLLYWDIGRGISLKQQAAGWGDAVVERLATDLLAEFPDMRGFSLANLWRMKQFYLAHSSPEFLAQAAREFKPVPKGTPAVEFLAQAVREMAAAVPWGHHVFLFGRLKDAAAHLYYLRATAHFGWSRSILLNQIKAGTYERAVKEKNQSLRLARDCTIEIFGP